MRTTLDIDTSVLEQVKRRAKAERKSVGCVVSELLAKSLADEPSAPAPEFFWPRTSAEFLIDIEDKDAVWALEGGDR